MPTAVFALEAQLPARIVYVIHPYPDQQQPAVAIKDLSADHGPVRVQITLPDGTIDQIAVDHGAEVTRQRPGRAAELRASVK